MFSHIKGKINLAVVNAADKGNPVAKRVVANEMQKFVETLPAQSPLVQEDLMIPDFARPLPEAEQGGMFGDYELVPLVPKPVSGPDLVGRRVASVMTRLGSYGMGDFGFVGLLFEDEDWLIIPITGAAHWVQVDGRILEPDGEGEGWIIDGDDRALITRLEGREITSATLGRVSLSLRLANGAELSIAEETSARPVFSATGLPRAFLPEDNLAEAVFLSPTGELSV